MNINLDYKAFCDIYYHAAEQVADITIAEHIKKHGQINTYIDVELVKDLAVSYGLEKVYGRYDVDHESKASVKTFLSTVVHNCVLTELGKESTAAGKRSMASMDSILREESSGHVGKMGGFRDYLESGDRFEKKEELITQMLLCMKKLTGVDQVILHCWMIYPKGDYTDMAIEELGWDNNQRSRNVVNVRCNRAIQTMRKKMENARSVYLDVFSSPEQIAPKHPASNKPKSTVDYNFIRRRQRAARKMITGGIDYVNLAKTLASIIPD